MDDHMNEKEMPLKEKSLREKSQKKMPRRKQSQREKNGTANNPEEMNRERKSPEEIAQEKAVPEKIAQEKAVPEEIAPEEAVSEKIARKEIAPEETAATEAAPEETARKEAAPEESKREENAPEENAPEENGRKKKKKEKKPKKTITVSALWILTLIPTVLFMVLLVVIAVFLFLRHQGAANLSQAVVQESVVAPEDVDIVEDDDGSITYRGQKYWYNEDLITFLCMGVDKSTDETSEENIGGNGQADAVFLAIINKETGKIDLISISREAMVDVNVYNTDGEYAGVENMQLCLSFAYGDGKESSCENVLTSVSRLFYGIPIHGYMAMDYNGLADLNDDVGGVTVNVLEDLTWADPAFVQGNVVTLQGEQAILYVRRRDISQLSSNNSRMQRQKQYLGEFLKSVFANVKSDPTLIPTLYSDAEPYMVTNVGLSEVTYLASLIVEHGYSYPDMCSVAGDVLQGETYAEFYVNKAALYDLIIEKFYTTEKPE